MRDYKLVILSVIGMMSFASCSEEYDNSSEYSPSLKAYYLYPSSESVSFDASAHLSQTVEIATVETPWQIQNSASWVSVSPSSGTESNTVTFSATENLSADTIRTAIDYLVSTDSEWKYSRPISISQSAAVPFIHPESAMLSFSGASSSQKIGILSNQKLTASATEDWITLIYDGSTLSVSVSENLTGSSRNGTIVLSGKSTCTISVVQSAANITVSTNELHFEKNAGTYSMTIESETEWTATTSSTWIQLEPTFGKAGKSDFYVSVSPNETTSDRTGYIYLYVGVNQVIQIPVTQEGLYIKTNISQISSSANSGTFDIQILSNMDWIVSSWSQWAIPSVSRGSGSQTITISVYDNNNVSSREGSIVISAPGVDVSASIKVVQTGRTFSVGETYLDFSDKASSHEVVIETDGSWVATTDAQWITVSPKDGVGNSKILVSVTENTSDGERSGLVSVSLGNKTSTIEVHQQGKYFYVDDDDLEFSSTGGVYDLAISTNDSWIASVEDNAGWISVEPKSGEGEVSMKITVSDNPSVNERSASLSVNTANGQNVKVKIKQKARFLSASVQSVNFFSKGGTSDHIVITTDGAFEITQEGDWFSVSKTTSNVFTVTATQNTSGTFREGSIVVKLTDLIDGQKNLTIPIFQTSSGGKFDKQEYPVDIDWNGISNGYISIKKSGYDRDENYNIE